MSSLLINDEIILKRLKAIIFDKDGTLIDIHYYWSKMINLRATLITKKWFNRKKNSEIQLSLSNLMGVNIKTNKIKAEGPVGIMPRSFIVEIVANYVRDSYPNVSDNEIENIFKVADNISSKDILSFLKILPGVEDLLSKLNRCQISSIIVSTDITSRANLSMKSLKLDHYFTKIIGADLVQKSKPFPDLAELALSYLDCDASEIAVIGDHPVDIKMGKSVNSGLNIGVLTGISTAEMFEDLECIVINDLNSIDLMC